MSNAITASGITKKYGEITALSGVDLTVPKGSITGLIGPDGAGKSTLFRIILSLERRDDGNLKVLSVDPANNKRGVREQTGYMPEKFSLYTDLTVEENLGFYFSIHRMKRTDFKRKAERLYRFNRLKPFARTRAGDLSGGMKQKLALSCALIHDPALLVLDEPTTGVDPLSRREFWNMLGELTEQGITILISTPYMEEALQCGRVNLVHRGQTLEEGEPSELIQNFNGKIFEIESEAVKPQKYISHVKGCFPKYPVFLSGPRIHLSAPLSTGEVRQKIEGGPFSLKVEQVTPVLEDLFLTRILTEEVNDGL